MNLKGKKRIAAETLKVGKERIIFNKNRLDEIKEAITKQDIRDLKSSGAISLKEIGGRRKIEKRKTRRRSGKIKVKVGHRKQEYVKLTRKLREYLKELKKQDKIDHETYKESRKKVKDSSYKSKRNLKENLNL